MLAAINYTDCQVIINDEEGNILSRTRVLEHNKYQNTINVQGNVLTLTEQQHVSLLILINNGVHEYHGTLRKSMINNTEIALYKGRVKESRSAKRYAVNAPGLIESMFAGSKPVPMLHPISILVINISTNGILFQTSPNCFALRVTVQIRIPAGTQNTVVKGTIVRINQTSETTAEYGCQF